MKGNLLTEAEINAIKHDVSEDLRFKQVTNESSLLLIYQKMEIKWIGKNSWTNNERGMFVKKEYSIYMKCKYIYLIYFIYIYMYVNIYMWQVVS